MAKKTKKNVSRKKKYPISQNTKKRRRTVRETVKHAALNPRFFSKIKQEYHDLDYVDQLSAKDKAWLASFMEETLGARFNHNGKKLIKSKTKKRQIYSENNARQRDVTSIGKAIGGYIDLDPEAVIEHLQNKMLGENIQAIDFHEEMTKKQEEPELLTKNEYLKLKKSGAAIPEEMAAFYDKVFKLK